MRRTPSKMFLKVLRRTAFLLLVGFLTSLALRTAAIGWQAEAPTLGKHEPPRWAETARPSESRKIEYIKRLPKQPSPRTTSIARYGKVAI